MSRGLRILVIIVILLLFLPMGYGVYAYSHFNQKKSECMDRVKSNPVHFPIVFDRSVKPAEASSLATALQKINKINVKLQAPKDILTEFKERHKDDAKNGVNQFLGDLSRLDNDNPFSYTLNVSFNLADAVEVAPKIKIAIKASNFKIEQPLLIDVAISEQQRFIEVFSKPSFFNNPLFYMKTKETNKFWKAYCGV